MFRIYLSGLLLLFSSIASACDLCNCYLGINPNYNQNTIGIRYRFSSYVGEHSHENTISNPSARIAHHVNTAPTVAEATEAVESYQTYELWGRWYPFKKLQLQASVPYSYNLQKEAGEPNFSTTGIGDVMVLAQYQVYNTMSIDTAFRQRILAGGGLKVPTGTFKQTASGESLNPHMQVGTGSYDYLAIVTYMFKYKKIGFSAEANYKLNTSNSNSFRFADRTNFNANLFYQQKIGNFTIMPVAGMYYEHAGYDRLLGIDQYNTGGNTLLGSAGIDTYYKRISLNLVAQQPVSEHLNGKQAAGQTRFIVGLNYSF